MKVIEPRTHYFGPKFRDNDCLVMFDSGKTLESPCGFVSINPNFDIGIGYDDFADQPAIETDFPEYLDRLSCAERCELADYMIDLWTQYKARYGTC